MAFIVLPGADASGNGNDWTANNINNTDTSSTTYDIMTDVPTLTDEDTSNFAVMNPVQPNSTGYLSQGNLLITGANSYKSGYSTIGFPSTGVWYWEGVLVQANNNLGFGCAVISPNSPPNPLANVNGIAILSNGYWALDSATSTSGHTGWSATTVVGMKWDSSTNTFSYTVDGTTYNTVGSVSTTDGRQWAPACWAYATNDSVAMNFGQRPFAYTPPAGSLKLNTFNLPDSSIVDGSENFNTVLYTGNGSTNAITGVGFSPDLVWGKNRGAAASNNLLDTVRGATKRLFSNSTEAEVTTATSLTSFDSDGFTLGSDAGLNTNTNTYVAWNWKAGGTAVSNTDGTITSTVSANTTSGFSVVTYTGNGTNQGATVGHGLGVTPAMVIVKSRVTAPGNWSVWHKSFASQTQGVLSLNLTDAYGTDAYIWGNTAPSSTSFGVGVLSTGNYSNKSGNNYVAYCFAEVEGYSKFGSYTGNGSADGPFVYTGFRPAYLLMKRTNAAGNWGVWDTARDPDNAVIYELVPNASDAETTAAGDRLDILSNGFKLRNLGAAYNASGGTYIYMAFAENPFKNSLAR